MLRFVLQRKKTRWEKLLLICQVLDLLEQDFHEIYPDEEQVIEDGFEQTAKDLFIRGYF